MNDSTCMTSIPSDLSFSRLIGAYLALVTASERADDESARALFDRMMAYSGRYRLRVDGCFITIVDSAWYPAWIGTEQTNFFTLDGDTLSIISPLLQHPKFPNDRVRGVAIWRKE
jgi:hypothetical protein